jgi:hypothetical protein
MKLIILITSIIFSINVYSENIYIYKTKTSRVDAEVGTAIYDLIESTVSEEGHDVVSSRSKADSYLRPKIMRLGNTYSVMLKRVKNKKVIYSSKLKSNGEDELDTVVSRLVRSALSGNKSGSVKRVGEITEKEVDEVSRRTESKKYTYFALGPYAFTNLDTSGVAYYLAYGQLWEVSTKAAIRLTVEGAISSGDVTASVVSVSGGMNYYFTPNSTSFFLGADFGYGAAASASDKVDSTAGFSLGGQAGVVFFRTSGTQMSLTARMTSVFGSNELGNPMMAGLALGFHY